MSSNPWKSLCPFKAISNSLEEFQGVIEKLKRVATGFSESGTPQKPSKPRNKPEQGHLDLIVKLELEQLPKVEAEVAVSQLLECQIFCLKYRPPSVVTLHFFNPTLSHVFDSGRLLGPAFDLFPI